MDGIWGLAYSSLSSWGGSSVVNTIISSYSLPNMFSLCLVETNPVMSIGLNYASTPGFQWIPIVEQAWYTSMLILNENFFLGVSLIHPPFSFSD